VASRRSQNSEGRDADQSIHEYDERRRGFECEWLTSIVEGLRDKRDEIRIRKQADAQKGDHLQAVSEISPGADRDRSCWHLESGVANELQQGERQPSSSRVSGDDNLRGRNRLVLGFRRRVEEVKVCRHDSGVVSAGHVA
jgi:hypothetical protein